MFVPNELPSPYGGDSGIFASAACQAACCSFFDGTISDYLIVDDAKPYYTAVSDTRGGRFRVVLEGYQWPGALSLLQGVLAMADRESQLKRKFTQRYEAEQAWRTEEGTGVDHCGSAPVTDVPEEQRTEQIDLEIQNAELRYTRGELECVAGRYYTYFHSAPCGYFVLDERARILEVNNAGAALLGTIRSELLGHAFWDYVESSGRTEFEAFISSMLESQESVECELLLKRAREAPFRGLLRGNRSSDRAAAEGSRVVVFDMPQRLRGTSGS